MTRTLSLLLAAFLFLTTLATAQDPHHLQAPILGTSFDLPQNWLFSPTDSPAYASPTLDDSTWTTISTQNQLTSYGFRNFPFAWYRAHLQIPPQSQHLAVEVQRVVGRYELFVNGTRIGAFGNMADHSNTHPDNFQSYPIPDSLLAASHGTLVLAFRFSLAQLGNNGRGASIPIANYATVTLASQNDVPLAASYFAAHNYGLDIAEALLYSLVGLLALALFLALRGQQEYLALALTLLLSATSGALQTYAAIHAPTPHDLDSWITELLSGLATVMLVEFVCIILKLPRTRRLLILQFVLVLTRLAGPLAYNGFLPNIVGFVLYFLPLLIVFVLLPVLVLRSWRSSVDVQLLLPAILLFASSYYFRFFVWLAYFLHLLHHLPSPPDFNLGTYDIGLSQCGDFAFLVAILFFIVLRTIRITRDRSRIAAEVAAAGTVQQLLLARSNQSTPGFQVESVYLPAAEVGGDFFLIALAADGSLMAIVGDVSGKGLPAAMRVAMILGILNRETSRAPATVLANLNSSLLCQGELGFTTACCVHLSPAGQYTLANAGHISPYLSGAELTAPPALPLGLAPDQTYETLSGYLDPGQSIVLLSDGVPEARSPKGALYGFDALPTLTLRPAREIAHTAQHFGLGQQDDDITVLTIALAPA